MVTDCATARAPAPNGGPEALGAPAPAREAADAEGRPTSPRYGWASRTMQVVDLVAKKNARF